MKRIWTLALVSLVLLAGCQMPLSPPPMATVGPVSELSGKRGIYSSNLTVSTNCVEVGETLVIQGTLKNEAAHPLRFEGMPPLDFIIRPGDWNPAAGAEPERRWSQTAVYPAIDPLLAPGESRTYEWQWIVEAVYGTPGTLGKSAIHVQFWRGAIKSEGMPDGGQLAWVGVGGLSAPESAFSFVPCQELRNR